MGEPLVDDTCDYWVPPGGIIPRVSNISKVEFMRDYFAQNKPCILCGMMDDWGAMARWNQEYLIRASGETNLNVNLTPDGLGDHILHTEQYGDIFVKPLEKKMTMEAFFKDLQNTSHVAYLSHQNDNLRGEMPFLCQDVPPSIDFVDDIFGPLDAINLWIGDERAVSSMHMDHYENIYCVVEGEKVFHLLPPTMNIFLEETEAVSARYTDQKHGELEIELETDSEPVPWIATDPVAASFASNAASKALIECHVYKGEILYLPAMWLHRATQAKLTIAVNYWYDQVFDLKWVYYSQLMRNKEKDK